MAPITETTKTGHKIVVSNDIGDCDGLAEDDGKLDIIVDPCLLYYSKRTHYRQRVYI